MLASFCCARCQRTLRVRRGCQGRTVHCPGCDAALVVPETLCPEPTTPAGSARCARRKEPVSPGTRSCAGVRVESVACPDPAPSAAGLPRGLVLPWLLLTPAILALALWMWAGEGLLWAGLGVGLGGLCLLLGQHGRWPLSARVAASLSLAILGHGLALASPRLNTRKGSTIISPATAPAYPDAKNALQSSSPSTTAPRPSSLHGEAPPNSAGNPIKPDLQFVVNLGELLSVAVAATPSGSGTAFLTTEAGFLKKFSYPDFRLQTTYRLQQPAYRAVLDNRRGLLWVAASDPRVLRVNRYGDRPMGRGDFHIYNVPPPRRDQLLSPAKGTPLSGLSPLSPVLGGEGRSFVNAGSSKRLHLLASSSCFISARGRNGTFGLSRSTLAILPGPH